MIKFNLNDHIYVRIKDWALEELVKSHGQSYVNSCILQYFVIIEGKEYYKLQAHAVMSLFGPMINGSIDGPIEPIILIN